MFVFLILLVAVFVSFHTALTLFPHSITTGNCKLVFFRSPIAAAVWQTQIFCDVNSPLCVDAINFHKHTMLCIICTLYQQIPDIIALEIDLLQSSPQSLAIFYNFKYMCFIFLSTNAIYISCSHYLVHEYTYDGRLRAS